MNRTATAVSVNVVAATGIGATTEQCRVTQSGFPMANYTLRRPRSIQRRLDPTVNDPGTSVLTRKAGPSVTWKLKYPSLRELRERDKTNSETVA